MPFSIVTLGSQLYFRLNTESSKISGGVLKFALDEALFLGIKVTSLLYVAFTYSVKHLSIVSIVTLTPEIHKSYSIPVSSTNFINASTASLMCR